MLGEFELIRRFFTPSNLPESVIAGVGDDCALLQVPPGCVLAVSVDTQVSGVHFPATANPVDIASRALRCAASDLVAMAAEPLGFTLALTLPMADEQWLAAFSRSLLETAEALHCPLVGGDTTRGPLTVSIQVHGSVPAGLALKRNSAQAGDDIWISGTLGDGAAALAMLEQRLRVDDATAAYLQQRFFQPDIDIALGVHLRTLASSGIDVSDGLLADLGHLCAASGLGADIALPALPLSPLWAAWVEPGCAQQWALAGGDDYRLCFTAPASNADKLMAWHGLQRIGRMVATPGIVVRDAGGVPCDITSSGYRHF